MELIYPRLPADAPAERPLPWYLAMEEHLAHNYQGQYFFTWSVGPTVIFGRHQIIEAEVNLPYCREKGIEFYRRKSGGGCVYADRDNLMLCMVASSADVPSTFAAYCEAVASALRELGVPAEVSGRNDITIEGRKVSGNSFLRIPPSRSIVHGTMLLGSDPATMERALTPSREKLESKGVRSVRSRVTTLRDYLPGLTGEELNRHLVSHFCGDRTLQLTADDIAEIDRLAAPYFTPEWIYGHATRGHERREHRHSARIEGVGEFLVSLATTPDGKIASVNLQGDFFLIGDLDALLAPLVGLPLDRAALEAALAHLDVPSVIAHLTPAALAALLTSKETD